MFRPQNSETISKVERQQGKYLQLLLQAEDLQGPLQGYLELCFGHVSLEMPVRPSNGEADKIEE